MRDYVYRVNSDAAVFPTACFRHLKLVASVLFLALRQNSWVNSDGNAGNPVGGCDQEKEGG